MLPVALLCSSFLQRAVWQILWWIVNGKEGFLLDGLALFLLLGCWIGWTVGIFIGLSQSTKAISYLVLCTYLLWTWILCWELLHFLLADHILFEEPVHIQVWCTPWHGKKSRKCQELWFGHGWHCHANYALENGQKMTKVFWAMKTTSSGTGATGINSCTWITMQRTLHSSATACLLNWIWYCLACMSSSAKQAISR